MNSDNLRGYWTEHHPASDVPYGFDWSDVLAAGESVTDSDWAADSTDLTLTRPLLANQVASVFAAGGVVGKVYKLTNSVTISPSGRVEARTMQLACQSTIR